MRNYFSIRGLGLLWVFGAMVLLTACPCGHWVKLALQAAPEGAGTAQVIPLADVYEAGMTVDLRAASMPGWRFDYWEGPVADPAVPVTTIALDADTQITAHFVPAALPGETSALLDLSGGRVDDDILLAIPDGASLTLPAGLCVSRQYDVLREGAVEIVLRDRGVSELEPVSFTNWVWAFDVMAVYEKSDEAFQFSTLNDETAVEPEFVAAGCLFSAPASILGLAEGDKAELYQCEPSVKDEAEFEWKPVACSTVNADGNLVFTLFATGRYAIGQDPSKTLGLAPDLGMSPLYDCVINMTSIINAVKVIEESTGEVFNAWVFTSIPPGQMPETTDWVVYSGDEPCMGRLENYGKRFRVRSPYANAFIGACILQESEEEERFSMSGPYEVNASGNPSSVPIENPYEQCERIFAAEVKVLILSRAGDYDLFVTEVLKPLRAAFDVSGSIASNVRIGWFKKMDEGYYAEVWVRTEECTRHVADAMTLVQQEGVSIERMQGRLLYIVDWRGGGPYVAAYTIVANNTGLGLRFYDPYWHLEGGVIAEHSLGGPKNNILKLVDMEYDCIHDTLWVIKADANGYFNLFRYDKPVYRYGDRPPDASINFPSFALRQLCVDPQTDRLYVHTSGDPEEDGDNLRVYGEVSTDPGLENHVTHVAFHYPNEPEPDMLLYDNIAPMGNTVLMINGYSLSAPDRDGLGVFAYNLATGNAGARFQAWASFGIDKTAPITKGVFSQHNNILYMGTAEGWNGFDAVYAIDAPSSWQSQWIVTDEVGNGYWTPDTPHYRVLRWAKPGMIWDLDVCEGDAEILAVCQAPALNKGEILLFNNANTASGDLLPFYQLSFVHGVELVELINPPSPKEN